MHGSQAQRRQARSPHREKALPLTLKTRRYQDASPLWERRCHKIGLAAPSALPLCRKHHIHLPSMGKALPPTVRPSDAVCTSPIPEKALTPDSKTMRHRARAPLSQGSIPPLATKAARNHAYLSTLGKADTAGHKDHAAQYTLPPSREGAAACQ